MLRDEERGKEMTLWCVVYSMPVRGGILGQRASSWGPLKIFGDKFRFCANSHYGCSY